MQIEPSNPSRRQFLRKSAMAATGASAISLIPAFAFSREVADEGIHHGPKGDSPQIRPLASK